jgi:hypothetical protein
MKRWARTTRGISAPPQRSQKKQARPTANAMGTFSKKRGTSEPKRISTEKPCSFFVMDFRRKPVLPSDDGKKLRLKLWAGGVNRPRLSAFRVPPRGKVAEDPAAEKAETALSFSDA